MINGDSMMTGGTHTNNNSVERLLAAQPYVNKLVKKKRSIKLISDNSTGSKRPNNGQGGRSRTNNKQQTTNNNNSNEDSSSGQKTAPARGNRRKAKVEDKIKVKEEKQNVQECSELNKGDEIIPVKKVQEGSNCQAKTIQSSRKIKKVNP